MLDPPLDVASICCVVFKPDFSQKNYIMLIYSLVDEKKHLSQLTLAQKILINCVTSTGEGGGVLKIHIFYEY